MAEGSAIGEADIEQGETRNEFPDNRATHLETIGRAIQSGIDQELLDVRFKYLHSRLANFASNFLNPSSRFSTSILCFMPLRHGVVIDLQLRLMAETATIKESRTVTEPQLKTIRRLLREYSMSNIAY
jgi:hypothetical protein